MPYKNFYEFEHKAEEDIASLLLTFPAGYDWTGLLPLMTSSALDLFALESILDAKSKEEHRDALEFMGIDNWNRPVFRVTGTERYFGSTDILFPYCESESVVLGQVSINDLEYFGSSFNCDPHGGERLSSDDFVILAREA